MKPPSAAIRPTGSGSTNGGNQRRRQKPRWRTENRKWKPRHPQSSPSSILAVILVRGTNWLGDAVMTTPALMRLREKFPDAHITLLTPEKLADLWTNHPAVNETIPFPPGKNVFLTGIKLRAGQYRPRPGIPKLAALGTGSFPRRHSAAHRLRPSLAELVSNHSDGFAPRRGKNAQTHTSGNSPAHQPYGCRNRKSEIGNRKCLRPPNSRVSASRRRAGRQPGTDAAAIGGDS